MQSKEIDPKKLTVTFWLVLLIGIVTICLLTSCSIIKKTKTKSYSDSTSVTKTNQQTFEKLDSGKISSITDSSKTEKKEEYEKETVIEIFDTEDTSQLIWTKPYNDKMPSEEQWKQLLKHGGYFTWENDGVYYHKPIAAKITIKEKGNITTKTEALKKEEKAEGKRVVKNDSLSNFQMTHVAKKEVAQDKKVKRIPFGLYVGAGIVLLILLWVLIIWLRKKLKDKISAVITGGFY